MHPLRHPRNAVFVGLIFVDHRHRLLGGPDDRRAGDVDYAGVTMLVVLGIAMALMFYVLIAGSARVTRSTPVARG